MPHTSLEEQELFSRLRWFIRLRWLAVAGVFLVTYFIAHILKLRLPYRNLILTAFLILVYNIIFLVYYRNLSRRKPQDSLKQANRFANIQISLDLIFLIALIHFSGGIENPFISYFIFHMIIASILLSARASYLQVTFAVSLFNSAVLLEYFKIIPHYCLGSFMGVALHENGRYLGSIIFVFMTTLYLSVYMASSISQRLRLRTKELMRANERLLEQDRLKNEYVRRVTHDIKAHLSAIESCLAPVADETTGPINERQRDLIGRAIFRTDKLLFFVQALLKLTQIRLAKDWPVQDLSLAEITHRSIETVEAKAKTKAITVTLDVAKDLPKIKANEIGIEEVFVDLLMNAVKYTPQGGKVTVSIKDLENQQLVEIQDAGIGISPEDIPRLFEEFFRAPNAKEIERDGTGLGLSIVKQIIERHGGQVWAESEGVDKGAKFSFTLPK